MDTEKINVEQLAKDAARIQMQYQTLSVEDKELFNNALSFELAEYNKPAKLDEQIKPPVEEIKQSVEWKCSNGIGCNSKSYYQFSNGDGEKFTKCNRCGHVTNIIEDVNHGE